ncbi:MAG: universal stress protein [Actinomycetales bacterium]|nr:universal stress protein [Actinomycetales bacterium]
MSLAVGYDGGDSAKRALLAAIALAKDLEESLLIVCGVAPAGGMGDEYTATEEALIEALAPLVSEAVIQAQDAGVAAEAILVDADPVGALETVMEERKPRMLVVGYGSSGRIRAALFGAVAPKMVERSDVPVLVVP